jgi:DNA helicase-2/ATP-dependent DNA helicase PcrA
LYRLALDALNEQLENNYKTKDWSRRVKDFDLVKQLARKHSALGEFLEEYVLDPISVSEIDKTRSRLSDADYHPFSEGC